MPDDHTLIRDYLLRMTTRGDLVAALDRLVRARDTAERATVRLSAMLQDAERERDEAREALRVVDTMITDRRLRAISPYVADKVRAALAAPVAPQGEAGE